MEAQQRGKKGFIGFEKTNKQKNKPLTVGNGDLDLDRDLQKFQKQPI